MSGRRTTAIVIMTTWLGACGGSSEPETAPTAGTRPPVSSCESLADRWVEIQQSFLDDLGDAAVADATSSPAVIEAGRRMGLLLLEQGRDVERLGCEAELAPGSPQLCAHLPELEPRGPAGRDVVDGLAANCP